MRGRIWSHSAKDENATYVKLPYTIQPPMGCSIGISGEPRNSGTLGGYIELWKEGVVRQCGLTCSHVLNPSSSRKRQEYSGRVQSGRPILSQKKKKKKKKNLLTDTIHLGSFGKSDTSNDSAIRVFYPSQVDHERTISRPKKAVELQQSEKERMEAKLRTSSGSDVSSRERIAQLSLIIEKRKEVIDTAISANRQVGTVFATSGVRLSLEWNCRIDWGLIELATERVGINKVSLYDSGM